MGNDRIKSKIESIKDLENFEYQYKYSSKNDFATLWIKSKDGKGIAAIYWGEFDTSIIYLSSLHVDRKYRHKRLGSKLIKEQERIANAIEGSVYFYMKVDKNTWMYDWYLKLGYSYLEDVEGSKDYIWLQKEDSLEK